MTHICISKLTIIGSDKGLAPGQRQTIIWTNAGILLIGPLGTNFSEILIGIQTFSFKKIHLKMSSAKWHPFCLGLNVLIYPLQPSDAIWHHRTWSLLVVMIACCLTEPRHYLNRCWLIITEVWHSPGGYFTDIFPWYEFDNHLFKITAAFLRYQWVKTRFLSTLKQVKLLSNPTASFKLVHGEHNPHSVSWLQ